MHRGERTAIERRRRPWSRRARPGRASVARCSRLAVALALSAGLVTLAGCGGGGGIDPAALAPAVTRAVRRAYPTLGIRSTRCRTVPRQPALLACAARGDAGSLAVDVRLAPRLRVEATDAVLPPNAAAQFVAAHTSIPALVTCGAGTTVARPGTLIPCQVAFSDQTTSTVQVQVLDPAGDVALLSGAPAPASAAPGGSLAWAPTGRTVLGRPAIFTAQSGGVGLAWFDPGLLHPVLVAGTSDPAGSPGPWGGEVPPSVQPALAAAFNSGFKMSDIHGGWVGWGTVWRAPEAGDASLVITTAGQATVGEYGRDVSSGPDTAFVRQNLTLLVDGGAPVAAASDPSAWGATVSGAADWRSALGVDAHGALVYAAGGGITPEALAQALVAAGVQRAMQLDINPMWISLNTYEAGPDGVVHGTKVYGLREDDRYLSPDSRDFVAMLVRGLVQTGATGRVGVSPLQEALRGPAG